MTGKYRFLTLLQSWSGLSRKIALKVKYGIMKKKNARALTDDDSRKIQDYYQQEDNSRLCAGVKLTVTCRWVKKQKGFSVTVKNLHKKYVAEGGRISYSKFCKLRPFWTVAQSDSDRDTCQCYMHKNVRYLVNALQSRGLLDTEPICLLSWIFRIQNFWCSTARWSYWNYRSSCNFIAKKTCKD